MGNNQEEASRSAAYLLIDDLNSCISEKGNAVWQVSSGGTPKRMYDIISQELANEVDWKKVTLVQMDEYLNVQPTDRSSQYYCIHQHLASVLPFNEIMRFDQDVLARPYLFDERIADRGGIDIAIHGIGVNGHLAFNEPGSDLNSRTRIVALTESTRIANSRFFDSMDSVPLQGITIGLTTIMETRKIYLLAFGAAKKKAILESTTTPASIMTPSSALQSHDNVVYILDKESAPATSEHCHYYPRNVYDSCNPQCARMGY